jgi:DNA-binding MarR family transcriptional regulator
MAEQELTSETDRLVDGLLEMVHRVQDVVSLVADRYELTPQQVGLLRVLDTPMSMRVFAEDLSCDPSNVTGLVDRAERLGLVERVSDPLDRRVRMLTLTAKGRKIRSRVNKDLASELGETLGSTAGMSGQIDLFLRTMPAGSQKRCS